MNAGWGIENIGAIGLRGEERLNRHTGQSFRTEGGGCTECAARENS